MHVIFILVKYLQSVLACENTPEAPSYMNKPVGWGSFAPPTPTPRKVLLPSLYVAALLDMATLFFHFSLFSSFFFYLRIMLLIISSF